MVVYILFMTIKIKSRTDNSPWCKIEAQQSLKLPDPSARLGGETIMTVQQSM